MKCDICINDFTGRKRKSMTCGCGLNACSECMKHYLTESIKDPDCMSCNRAIDRGSLCDWVGQSWVNGAYKAYQSNILLDREKSKLAATIPAAKRVLDIRKKDEEIADVMLEIQAMRDKIYVLNGEKWTLKGRAIVRRQFNHKCSVDGCMGSLSSAWKCGLCETFSCSECFAVKGKDRDAPHECNPDDVATATMIKKDSKPCPGCSAAIIKTEGCDQMFCTVPGCNTAFSWRTGLKVNGTIHNPHYHQMLAAGLITPGAVGRVRAPGDRLCGGPPEPMLIRKIVNKVNSTRHGADTGRHRGTYQNPQCEYLANDLVRGMGHVGATIDYLRHAVQGANDHEDLRVKLLLKEISEADVKKFITRDNKKRQQQQAMLHVAEIYNNTLNEQLREILNGETRCQVVREPPGQNPIGRTTHDLPVSLIGFTRKQWEDRIHTARDEIERVREYCNEQLVNISRDYKTTPRRIPEHPYDLRNF